MFLLNYPQAGYVPLVKLNSTESRNCYKLCEKPTSNRAKKWRTASIVALLGLACITAGFLVNEMINYREPLKAVRTGKSSCGNPSRRMEWRSLSIEERLEYINAVRCLAATPSKQLPQDTLYDDIAYVHIDTGVDCEFRNT
jgi:hypothetical protein